MKASELIRLLQGYIAEHGDLGVYHGAWYCEEAADEYPTTYELVEVDEAMIHDRAFRAETVFVIGEQP